VYDMYPWGDPADAGSAEPRNFEPRPVAAGSRHVPAAAIRAVQVALDRRDNGGDAVAAAAAPVASQPTAPQPAAPQPAAPQPAAPQPAASKPTASQPGASKPRASKPGASKPTASRTRQ
jgi:hypothetical protein